MDISLITGLGQSLSVIRTLVSSAVDLRDFSRMAEVVSKLSAEILKAQERLLSVQGVLIAAQQESFEAKEEIRKLREALAEKEGYEYFELAPHRWVKRRKISPEEAAARAPGSPEPQHYFCDVCFTKGFRCSLVFYAGSTLGDVWECPNCHNRLFV